MNQNALKLTTYFGERDRYEGRFLAEALLDVYERCGFRASVLLRGVEGFGVKHHLRTERLLTLSEDLPLVTVAVDTRERITAAMREVTEMRTHGLVTLERAHMLTGEIVDRDLRNEAHEATKLTVYCGRQERANGKPAFVAVVDLLHRHGVAGATVFLGVDGTTHGLRQRATFFGRNARVPLMIVAVGAGERIAQATRELSALLDEPLATLERVRVCKRDGESLAEPRHLPDSDGSGLPIWQKLMVYTGEYAKFDGRPLYVELIRRLRAEGASGATALRGIWGYYGDHPPHGDKLLALQRRVPVLTVIVDTPVNVRRLFTVVDAVTAETGLVTSEMVPTASRALEPDIVQDTLRLARWPA